MAEVTLVLDNTDGTLPLDFTEVAVHRRVYRSGESEFLINRSPVRLKDIQELFFDTGLGKRSLFGNQPGEDRCDSFAPPRRPEKCL